MTSTVADDDIEFATRDRISALQLERMRSTLAHAYENVPHYRRAFDEAYCDTATLPAWDAVLGT